VRTCGAIVRRARPKKPSRRRRIGVRGAPSLDRQARAAQPHTRCPSIEQAERVRHPEREGRVPRPGTLGQTQQRGAAPRLVDEDEDPMKRSSLFSVSAPLDTARRSRGADEDERASPAQMPSFTYPRASQRSRALTSFVVRHPPPPLVFQRTRMMLQHHQQLRAGRGAPSAAAPLRPVAPSSFSRPGARAAAAGNQAEAAAAATRTRYIRVPRRASGAPRSLLAVAALPIRSSKTRV
jgi:hypothetical protein